MPLKPELTAEYLKEAFFYDPETGELFWQERPRHHFKTEHTWKRWNSRNANTPAGSAKERGKIIVCLDKRMMQVHRIIWIMVTGETPKRTVDHRDRNAGNNRWGNLREANRSQQNVNLVRRNPSGFRGITPVGKKWIAQICMNGTHHYLGISDTKEAAHAAYCEAAERLHGEFKTIKTTH